MRRLLFCAFLLAVTASASLAQGKEKRDNFFGPWYADCDYSQFKSLYVSLHGQDSIFEMKVPSLFRNKFRKEIVKMADIEKKAERQAVEMMAKGLEDIYMLSYGACPSNFRDSIDKVLISKFNPLPNNYSRDSCCVYGFHSCKDTLKIILMHVASKSAIIYMTGSFPCKFD